MIKNYFKIALRNLRKNKLYASINIFGLTIGLTACLLIGLYIANETSYDTFNEKANRIVRTTMEYKLSNEVNFVASTGTKVGPEFERRFPSVEAYARTYLSGTTVKNNGKAFNESRVLFADPAFFNMFSFQLKDGNADAVLSEPNNVVLTESMAKKYFGSENPIGKTLTMIGKEMTVSGVCADSPKNSQIKFDFVTQFLNFGNGVDKEQWWTANWVTYFLLKNESDISNFESQVNAYMATDIVKQEARLEGNSYLKYHFEPLLDVHLKSNLSGFEPNGSMTYIYVFIIIAIVILLIAIANYTNLATAQSTSRSGEIGIRKVMGASKNQVFSQFISESTTITLIATVLALILSIAIIPYFNDITGKEFVRQDVLQPIPLLLMLLFCVVVSLLSGFYPAFILSKSKVINVLKKGFSSTGGNNVFRKSLIVGQFAISVFLIIFTIVILQQMNFVQNKNLGYNKDHVVVLPIRGNMMSNFKSIKESFQNISGVTSVTASYETPEFVQWSDGVTVNDENGKHDVSINAMPIDLDFVKTMDMSLVAGRDFMESDFTMMDTTNNYANYKQPYLINRTLAERIGWTPEEAIGRAVEKNALGPVLGVVEDFNFDSLHEPIGPLLFFLSRDFSQNYMLRISETDVQGTLSKIEAVWNKRVPERPFNYHFLDEDYNALYKAEKRTSLLFSVAAILAVILACLGLFGLVAYATVQRTKEIGIRKALGASLTNIMVLVSKNFFVLIAIAIGIASPLAFYISKKWLQNFAFKIEPQLYVFVAAAFLTLLIAFLTLGYHSLKAGMTNPVDSLKTE